MTHSLNAAKLIDTLAEGGVALFGVDVGYAIVGNHEAAIARIFRAKQRSFDKPCGLFSNWAMVDALALLDDRSLALMDAVTRGHGLPLSVVTPYRADHAFFARLTATTRLRSSRAGTIDMLLNAGTLHDSVAAEAWRRGVPVLGSSANRSLTGSKYRLAEVEPEVVAAADLVLDIGDTKYAHPEGMGSTIIELPSGRALRRGILFDEICDILAGGFSIDPRRIA